MNKAWFRMVEIVIEQVEIIVGKGEHFIFEHFLFIAQCFKGALLLHDPGHVFTNNSSEHSSSCSSDFLCLKAFESNSTTYWLNHTV